MLLKTIPLWSVFALHYDDDGGAGDDPPTPPTGKDEPKPMTQAQIDKIVQTRTEKARKAQKEALDKFEQLQATLNMTEEQRADMEREIETLRKQTLSAEEIAKREAKKAKDEYESKLTVAEKSAHTWKQQYLDLKINYEISSSAQKHGTLGSAVPVLESFLKPKVQLSEVKGDAGISHSLMIEFPDTGADGKPVSTQLTVDEAVKRMKELPEMYGYLFQAPNSGGLGGNAGTSHGKGGFRPGMSSEEYMRLRKENPAALYGS